LVRSTAALSHPAAAVPHLLPLHRRPPPHADLARGPVLRPGPAAGAEFLLADRLGLVLVAALAAAFGRESAGPPHAAHRLGIDALGRCRGPRPGDGAARQRANRRRHPQSDPSTTGCPAPWSGLGRA